MFNLYGAWIGDMAGNDGENCMKKTEGTEAFKDRGYLSNTSFLTAAVASAIIGSREEQFHHGNNAKPFRDFVLQETKDFLGKNPCGISAAGYVSPCGMAAVSLKEAVYMARVCAEATDKRRILEAEAVACAVFLAKTMKTREYIRQFLKEYFFDPDAGERPAAKAIVCFLASTDFWDAIRRALMSGGESRCEVTSITGSLSWCFFPTGFDDDKPESVAQQIRLHAEQHVPDKLKEIDGVFSDMSSRRAGTHFRTGFCTSIMSRDEELDLLRKEKEEEASGLRKLLLNTSMPTDDIFMMPAASKKDQ